MSQNLYPGDLHSLILDGLEALSADYRCGHSLRDLNCEIESPIVQKALKELQNDAFTFETETKNGTFDEKCLEVELSFGSFQHDLLKLINGLVACPIIIYRDYSYIKGDLLYLVVSE